MSQEFRAFQVQQVEKKVFKRAVVTRTVDDLDAGELLVKVHTRLSTSKMRSPPPATRV